MLGPLPRLHTLIVLAVALLVGTATGVLVGLSDLTGAGRLAGPGALVGAAVAALTTYALLHDHGHGHHQH
jgi:hypothetical protein